MSLRNCVVGLAVLLLLVITGPACILKPLAKKPSTKPTTKKAATRPQQICLHETDPSSPRHTRLKSPTTNPDEIVRIDVDGDGTPDILETWWNGKRVRWLDENHNMKWTDTRGDMTGDALQIDRDGDGYYDGPGDLNIKWGDDDGDGRPDVQIFAANPSSTQPSIHHNLSHYMVFIDIDHDGVNGYIDWNTFEFYRTNWHTTGLGNFSPDYNGNSVFLKQHDPPWVLTDPRYNWESPFAFYDFDDDGCTEMAIRLLDTTDKADTKAAEDDKKAQAGLDDEEEQAATKPVTKWDDKAKAEAKAKTEKEELNQTYRGAYNEAFVTYDLDNDSGKGNEFDFDMSIRFFSDKKNKGKRVDYKQFHDRHPSIKAPQWVIDGHYFRYDNWRKIDEFVYATHDKAYDLIWDNADKWGGCWLVFDEDDDDHRWERVEFYYPEGDPYSVKRWKDFKKSRDRKKAGLGGHVQADSLGDRGEWDKDNSGHGQLYVGKFDGRIHLYGTETGCWLLDEGGKFWGGGPVVVGGSSKENAKHVEEVVQYKDTDNNGFFDQITFDYDGDKKIDLTINLLDYKTSENQHPDVQPLINPGKAKWQGLHELFNKIAYDSFEDGLKIYRAAWKKGVTTREMEDVLSFAASRGEEYDHGYFLKEKVFRAVDDRLAAQGDATKPSRNELRRRFFTGDFDGVAKLIESLDLRAPTTRSIASR